MKRWVALDAGQRETFLSANECGFRGYVGGGGGGGARYGLTKCTGT